MIYSFQHSYDPLDENKTYYETDVIVYLRHKRTKYGQDADGRRGIDLVTLEVSRIDIYDAKTAMLLRRDEHQDMYIKARDFFEKYHYCKALEEA